MYTAYALRHRVPARFSDVLVTILDRPGAVVTKGPAAESGGSTSITGFYFGVYFPFATTHYDTRMVRLRPQRSGEWRAIHQGHQLILIHLTSQHNVAKPADKDELLCAAILSVFRSCKHTE